jgi:hypothetical protein
MARFSRVQATKLFLGRAGTAGSKSPVEITATAAEINAAADVSSQEDAMAASAVVAALLETYEVSVRNRGNIIYTSMLIDLTGVKSTTTTNDVIGDTGNCDFGQATDAVNGVIQGGQITCLETPAGGVDDIDFGYADVTGVYDADGTALTGWVAMVTRGAAWAMADRKGFNAWEADHYLVLNSGTSGTASTYTAGKFLIETWGIPA